MAAPRPFWDKPATGTAATWCASCSSSRRRPASWSASSTTSSSAKKPFRPTRCSSRCASRFARATTTSPGWSGRSWRRGISTRITPFGSGSRGRWSTCWGRCRRCIGAMARTTRTTGRCRSRCWSTWLGAMGQHLFAPPNVKGWPGGPAWLNTSTLLERDNFAAALAMGTLWSSPAPESTAAMAAAAPLRAKLPARSLSRLRPRTCPRSRRRRWPSTRPGSWRRSE